MFKQVFTKLFRTTDPGGGGGSGGTNSQQRAVNSFEKAPIYAIPTISQCFQSSNTPTNSFYSNESTNCNSSSHHTKSMSSSSSCSSTSSKNSFEFTFNKNNNNSNNSKIKQQQTKFSESNTRQIYIAPHCIRYSNSTLDDTIYRIDDESLNEIAAEILESENCPPKLQIVYYAGKYFAINNSHLQIYKQLQLSGLITHVQADVISVEAIPYALRQHLLQAPCLTNSSNSNEISDEEFPDVDETIEVFDKNAQTACSSRSAMSSNGGLAEILSANILSPASIEIISKEMLVDETYEFGNCENCVESDEEENEEEEQEEEDDEQQKDEEQFDQIKKDKIRKKSTRRQVEKMHKNELNEAESAQLFCESNDEEDSKWENSNNSKEQEIIEKLKEDYEWKNYEKLCSSANEQMTSKRSENSPKTTNRRRQNSSDMSSARLFGNLSIQMDKQDDNDDETELDNLLIDSNQTADNEHIDEEKLLKKC